MKITHKTEYATVPNSLLALPSLSMKAKGIYAYIQSKPIGWSFSKERIAKETAEGVDALRSGMDELVSAGYLRINKLASGRTELELLDRAEPQWEKAIVGKSHSGKNPQWENPTDNKTIITNVIINKKEKTQQMDILSEEIYCAYMERMPKDKKKYAKKAQACLYISSLLKSYDSISLLSCIASYKKNVDDKWWKAPQYFFANTKSPNAKEYMFFLDYMPTKEEQERKAKPLEPLTMEKVVENFF